MWLLIPLHSIYSRYHDKVDNKCHEQQDCEFDRVRSGPRAFRPQTLWLRFRMRGSFVTIERARPLESSRQATSGFQDSMHFPKNMINDSEKTAQKRSAKLHEADATESSSDER